MVSDVQKPMVEATSVKEEVVNHLIFHKSLIDEKKSGERIDRYLGMIENMDEGEYPISDDPFEGAIASVFNLVIEEKMDPWDIDLISFTQMYLEEAKDRDKLDLFVAGQIINMAWSILKMQCEEVLASAEEDKGDEEEEMVQDDFFCEWEVDDYELYEEPEDIDYEERVLDDNDPPLDKAVRREEKKPVSLIQLVDAFEEAKKEAKYREKMDRLRREKKEEREKEKEERKKKYDTNAHKEDLQHDLTMIWQRICWFEQDLLDFDMIHDGRRDDLITAFMSVLFLHKRKKLRLVQEDYPEAPIMIEVLESIQERDKGRMKLEPEKKASGGMLMESVITV